MNEGSGGAGRDVGSNSDDFVRMRVHVLGILGATFSVACAPPAPVPKTTIDPPSPSALPMSTERAVAASTVTIDAPSPPTAIASNRDPAAPPSPAPPAASSQASAAPRPSAAPVHSAVRDPSRDPWTVNYTILKSEESPVTWCTKTASATCFHGSPPSQSGIGGASGAAQSPTSKRFPSCAAMMDIPCECHHCGGSPTTGQRCTQPLVERVTATARGRAPDACCYSAGVNCGYPGEGRLLRSGATGDVIVPRSVARDGWGGSVTAVPHDNELAAHWARVACMEHASVSSFAKASLDLARLGAPAELLRDVHLAALDEIRHAEVAFTLAATYGGTNVGPDGYDAAAAIAATPLSPETLFRTTFLDGCVQETVGVGLLRYSADRAADAAVARAMHAIADDEERHAALAWRTLAWLRVAYPSSFDGGDLGAELIREVREMTMPRATPYVSSAEAAQVAGDVVAEVLEPCMAVLFQGMRAAA